ncbi:major paralogous domain-containing protein [Chryseobacterium rhizoplanae]|uniref:Major paralogous domain-containing protein n=1 Tax=Chryseobacterium rhizoplanae TaxID=1609531 RepID=A0A521DLH5_9FLAO|nr:FISUMP domain-containing protein [Chryseobacterium rhizoplanae]SMO72557.1 major paralogous domain-containing protein [Chryseobacterium rhizoplanae]
MRKIYLLPTIFFGSLFYGQTFIDASEGLIIPRLTGNFLQTAELKGVYSNAKDAILVYVTAPPDPERRTGQVEGIDSKGFYYFDAASNRWVRIISRGSATAALSQLLCSSSTNIGILEATRPASGVSVIVPYNGGNGGVYPALSVPSMGITNLNATLYQGNLSVGGGFLVFNITGIPLTTGTAIFNINIAGKDCSFSLQVQPKTKFDDVVNVSINGQIRQIMSRNLGANPTQDPDVPSQAIMGDYFQWGKRNAVATPYTPDVAIAGWSTEGAADKAWNSGTETNPLKTVNDPCPSGFRLPTRNEWVQFNSASTSSTIGTWATTPTNGPTNFTAAIVFNNNGNTLTLPVSGYRNEASGSLQNRARFGYYWSSTESSTSAYALNFGISAVNATAYTRGDGFSIRCISE